MDPPILEREKPGARRRAGCLARRDEVKYELNFMSVSSPDAALSEAELQPNGHTARRLETRRKLLEAGTELFAEEGVRSVTSSAIARRAGVATGTFYLHFPDKHALFEELVDAVLDEMRPQLRPDRAGQGSADAIRGDLEQRLDVAERRRSLIRAVVERGERSGLAERIQDRIARAIEERYTRVFRERGITLHPGAAAQARAAVLVRVIAWWAEDPSRARREEIIDILTELAPGRVREGDQ